MSSDMKAHKAEVFNWISLWQKKIIQNSTININHGLSKIYRDETLDVNTVKPDKMH